FIILTFFVLVIVEIRSSQNISIFYYVLVAFALILFFSLLSALSEHTGFSPAYLIASVATIGLLTAFFRSLMKNWWVVVAVSGMLTVLYTFIFILLALKDYAYLAGNIGLFVLLAVLMMVSSRYKLFRS
ncbi:MAG: cell envelope integrity protein CreD, partial [Bacteroidetes bacterium]|nr:cell envelope integrity protein CreD [Bacteroidota bacterium]